MHLSRGGEGVTQFIAYNRTRPPSLDPTVGILINVSEDHLDRHGTLEHYAAVKERLIAGPERARR